MGEKQKYAKVQVINMTSKEIILKNLTCNETYDEDFKMSAIDKVPINFITLIESFKSNHSEVVEINSNANIGQILKTHFQTIENCINTIDDLSIDSIDLNTITDPKQLNNTHIAIIKAEFAVCENGALWIDLTNFKFKIIPFICENLIVVLYKSDIVATMIDAYERIENEEYAYGTFIAGPSKTADIEQTLVTGAQGARRLLVVIIE